MDESDQDLMARIVGRDARAFEVVFERHREMVRAHLVRMLRDEQAAADLAQEVFLRVWTRSGQWSGQGSLAAWLSRIATNLGLNHLRSQRRRRQAPLEMVTEEDQHAALPGWMIDAAAVGPDMQAEMAERRELLRGMVERLPEEKREAIRLVHEAELEIREAAKAMGVAEGTIKSRLHYATRHTPRIVKRRPDRANSARRPRHPPPARPVPPQRG